MLPLWRWRPTIVSHGRRSRPPATLYRMQVIFKRKSGCHTTLACLSRPTRHDLRRTDHSVLRCPRLHPWTRQWSQSVMRNCLRSTPNHARSCSSRCAFDQWLHRPVLPASPENHGRVARMLVRHRKRRSTDHSHVWPNIVRIFKSSS